MEIFTIGGYNEVGRNMSAVKVGDDIVILDMGYHMEKLIEKDDSDAVLTETREKLIEQEILPDDSILTEFKDKVRAVVLSHAHLDHIGAVTKLAQRYDCPIIGTPYTLEVLKRLFNEEKKYKTVNKFVQLNAGSTFQAGEIEVEFIRACHSTPQTVLVALHTKEGNIIYANDFKFDNSPTLGKTPDYDRLKALGKEGVKVLFAGGLNLELETKTPSEVVAKQLISDIIMNTENKDNLIMITTFASHIARIKSIAEIGAQIGRKVVLLGRSMYNYMEAAEKVGIVNLGLEIYGKPKEIQKKLSEIEKEPEKYIVVLTGNQGEPDATLFKIIDGRYEFKFVPEDQVVFSCFTIPSPVNEANRFRLEKALKSKGVRLFKDVHVSGHASKEDHRDLLRMLNPQYIIPCHVGTRKKANYEELGMEEGYQLNKTLLILQNGEVTQLN